MKVQDFAYNVAMRTMDLLEEKQHYKIPPDTRKDIGKQILAQLNEIMKAS